MTMWCVPLCLAHSSGSGMISLIQLKAAAWAGAQAVSKPCTTQSCSQGYAPPLKCEVVRGHKSGTIISARYAFLLVDLFFPLPPEVRCAC